jgi:hypothetical protein
MKNNSQDTPTEVKVRNKMLMGSIMSHLGKAKEKLNQDMSLLNKQSTITQKISEETRSACEILKEQQLLDTENKIRNLKKSQVDVENRIIEVEKELYVCKLADNYDKMSNFIQTQKSTPNIFWVPAQSNEETLKLLENTKQIIKVFY